MLCYTDLLIQKETAIFQASYNFDSNPSPRHHGVQNDYNKVMNSNIASLQRWGRDQQPEPIKKNHTS